MDASDEEITSHTLSDIKTYLPNFPEHPEIVRIYRWKEAVCSASGRMLGNATESSNTC